jgi:magnesium chelatase subunit D
MNPEEGELRPQIADRIGLQLEITALTDPEQRVEVIKRREAFLADPLAFAVCYEDAQEAMRQAIARATALVSSVRVPERIYRSVARLTLKFEVESHRADITMVQCAKALAALDGRSNVEAYDIWKASTLTLGHRLPHDPFVPGPALDPMALRRNLEDMLEEPIELKKKALTKMQSVSN